MDIRKFIGTWKSESGNVLEITPFRKNLLKVNFISGETGKPVSRNYFENKQSINMYAALDFYETSLQVELWKKGTGFQLILLYDLINFKNEESDYCLVPGLSQYESSNLTERYGYLFEPLKYYTKTENYP
jgi:hypothetical protein